METKKETITIQKNFEEILSSYTRARTNESFGSDHPLWTVFTNLQNSLTNSVYVGNYPKIQVKWSVGQGNWAKVPWISFLDQRETTTTRQGVYAVFLFRQDMSGVYLTFNQGVTEPKKKIGTVRARKKLQGKAQNLRSTCELLVKRGFSLDNEIDLRVNSTFR